MTKTVTIELTLAEGLAVDRALAEVALGLGDDVNSEDQLAGNPHGRQLFSAIRKIEAAVRAAGGYDPPPAPRLVRGEGAP